MHLLNKYIYIYIIIYIYIYKNIYISLLFDNNKPWCKKNNANMFDVTMGSFDGAEVYELVGLLILSKLKCEFDNKDIGLYRDYGLAVFRNMGPRSADT